MVDIQIFSDLGVRISSSFLRERITEDANSLIGSAEPSADLGVVAPYFICHLFAPNYVR